METLPAEPMQQCAIPDVPPLRIRTHVSLSSPYGDSPAKCGTAVNALLDSTPTPTRHAMDAASSMVDTPAKPTMDENAAPLYMDASPTQAGKCSAKDSDFNLSAALNMISSRMGNDDEMEDEPQLQLDRPSARALRPQVANTIGVDPTRGKSVDVSPSKLMVSARGPRSCSRPALSPRLPPAGTTPAQVAPLNFARSESTASLPRAAATATSIGATRAPLTGRRGSVCGPPPMPAPTSYAFDVSRYLKELSRRGQEGQTLRWLPVQHQLQQLLAQEEMLREQLLLQESSGRQVVVHRRSEDHAKREEQRAIQASKARMEELKRRQMEELQNLKKTVADNTKLSETELREKLRYLVQLQPRLNVVGAVLTAMKTQAEDHLHLLGDLLEEDRNLQKAMRSDARLGGAAAKVRSGAEDKTATVGLAPLWMKHCLVASFNTAAILQRSSLRAAVQESSSTASAAIASGPTTPSVASARGMGAMTPRRTGGAMSSTAADRRVLVVRKEAGGAVVAWGHTRCGAQVVAMAEEYAANPPGAPLDLLPAGSSVRLVNAVGVIWPKEMLAELMRRAKNAPPPLADVIATSSSKLTFADVSSYEMSTRDVLAMGEEILMAA